MDINSKDTLLEALGIQILKMDDEGVIATMPVDSRTHQPFGILHGGASVALAETAASVGSFHFIDQENEICVGLEINANHIRSKKEGIVTAHAKPVHVGKTTMVWEIKIVDEQEDLICISRCTIAVLKKKL
ncbi:hotdog fold thioesterase [Metabacillus fastidiosus]|uniref:Hotdog fold thioesterase n=1 Tax=Metabacillus fastidiosus TaxID=1458 RepID=A0ABU6P4E1_9BACI|nr:hotdog fold thioesterase [Metabacillus fastidiosus]MED4403016.1 hotdog fold thioesterase [Metabacillus fastidiosus]MED4461434.1 hotdog fold thioesterase [Metabacillus fastidiosus]